MSRPRRVLVFAYYFPPLGLSGVQRIAKFVKYLPDAGWTPVVVTAEPRAYFAFDDDLRSELDQRGVEVHETGSSDPTRAFGRRTVPYPREWQRRAFSLISGFLFVPDNKRSWQSEAVAKALQLHDDKPFDAVLATAPPYTTLRAGRVFSRRTGLPLVSDFRDNWLGNPRHDYPTAWHRRTHARMEAEVVHAGAAVVTINRYIASDIRSRHGDICPIHVIPQGFDPEDFARDRNRGAASGDASFCVFVYAGTFYDAQQPGTFLAALRQVLRRRVELRATVRVRFIGTFAPETREAMSAADLSDVVTVEDYTSHRDVCQAMMDADVLWMTVGRQRGEEQISTGKLFEYFGTRKPILGLVPEGAARDALESYSAGFVCSPDDFVQCASHIERLVDLRLAGELPVAHEDEIAVYDRRSLGARMAQVLDEAVDGSRGDTVDSVNA